MIINFVVFSALFIAAVYIVLWVCDKEFRNKIEQPKFRFQTQLAEFEDKQNVNSHIKSNMNMNIDRKGN